MSHERSETIDIGQPSLSEIVRQRFQNVYGRDTPQAGQPLPGEPLYYSLLEQAVKAAIARSQRYPHP